MPAPTVPKLPTIRGCGQSATVRIEAYSPRDGRMHGSLDGTAYTCDAHADRAADAITAAGFTPHRTSVYVTHRIEVGAKLRLCGDGVEFTGSGTRIINAPESPTAEQLAAALRAGARDVHEHAALDIVLGLPYALYARQDLRDRYIVSTVAEATVLWATLHDDLRTGMVPVSSGERRMLLLACSLAVPANPVSLNEAFTGLDYPNALLMTAALQRLARGHR